MMIYICEYMKSMTDNVFHRETREENESKENWRKDLLQKRLEWAARTDRREYQDRIRSLTVIRIPR